VRIYFERFIYFLIIVFFARCFPHIVNLACKAVLAVLTNVVYLDDSQPGYMEYDASVPYDRDVIATIRSFISTVCFKASESTK
jgi:hypothetical protein